MKTLLTACTLLAYLLVGAQDMSYQQFKNEAKINKRLLPKYGELTKSEDEKLADQAFIEESIKEHNSRAQASKKMVEQGYKILTTDPRTAMYHFNQAYLLDSTNANLYWGYGRLYYQFQDYKLAAKYFKEGLELNPKNIMLLNALAENFYSAYKYAGYKEDLDSSISVLKRSFMVNPKSAETSRLLCINYLEKKNCEKARKYYQVYISADNSQEDLDLMHNIESNCKTSQ